MIVVEMVEKWGLRLGIWSWATKKGCGEAQPRLFHKRKSTLARPLVKIIYKKES